jgi:hypothetical protein
VTARLMAERRAFPPVAVPRPPVPKILDLG